MQPIKFYNKQKKCWAIRYGEQIEYFNHEDPLHDKRNLEAYIKFLQYKEKLENAR